MESRDNNPIYISEMRGSKNENWDVTFNGKIIVGSFSLCTRIGLATVSEEPLVGCNDTLYGV